MSTQENFFKVNKQIKGMTKYNAALPLYRTYNDIYIYIYIYTHTYNIHTQ